MKDSRYNASLFDSIGRGLRLPVTAGCIGWFYHTGNSALAARNYAPDGNSALVIGTPTYFDGYTRFAARQHYLQTLLAETPDLTLLSAFRSPAGAGSQKWAVSNLGDNPPDTTQYGAAIRSNTAGNVALGYGYDNAGTTTYGVLSRTVPDIAAWAFFSGRRTANGAKRLKNYTLNTYTEGVAGQNIVINPSKTFLIGSDYGDVAAFGPVDSAYTGIFTRSLSDAEEEDIYGTVKLRLSSLTSAIAI